MSQHVLLDGVNKIDFIARYEKLDADFEVACERIFGTKHRLPVKNSTRGQFVRQDDEFYREFYDN